MKMGYNERLMNESLKGDDDSLDELKFYAGSGDCEAQYFLAMYYARACGHWKNPKKTDTYLVWGIPNITKRQQVLIYNRYGMD